MTERDAIALIRNAITSPGGDWADLGAGTGTFTRALASLVGSSGHVLAVEPNSISRKALLRQASAGGKWRASISAVDGDFTGELPLANLTGILMANSLHFVARDRQAAVLRQLTTHLQPHGKIVLVEYDCDVGSEWVPYPVSPLRFDALCQSAGLLAPTVTGRMLSAFGGSLYSACTSRG